MWCEKNTLDVSGGWGGKRGYFGLIGRSKWSNDLRILSWYECREDWHRDTNPGDTSGMDYYGKAERTRFAFCVGDTKKGPAVAALIAKVEAQLGLPSRVRSRFGPTYRHDVIWFRQAAWWRRDHMRRYLFTALMRAGLWYNPAKDNFDYALSRRVYTSRTTRAIKHFLGGRTVYALKSGAQEGWLNVFKDKTDQQIMSLLLEPKANLDVA